MPGTPRRNMLFGALLSPVLPVLGAEAGLTPCQPGINTSETPPTPLTRSSVAVPR